MKSVLGRPSVGQGGAVQINQTINVQHILIHKVQQIMYKIQWNDMFDIIIFLCQQCIQLCQAWDMLIITNIYFISMNLVILEI